MDRRTRASRVLMLCVFVSALVSSGPVRAGSPSLVLSERFLNRILDRIGVASDGGVTQPYLTTSLRGSGPQICEFFGHLDCPEFAGSLALGMSPGRIPITICRDPAAGTVDMMPVGEPIPWQWWVKGASFKIVDGAMSFTATVITHVDNDWKQVTRTVPAHVELRDAKLQVVIDEFIVTLENGRSREKIDVDPVRPDRYYAIQLPTPIEPVDVPRLSGGTKTVRPVIHGAGAAYHENELRLRIDVYF